jgi:multiple sugar transport system substrate-binding protein
MFKKLAVLLIIVSLLILSTTAQAKKTIYFNTLFHSGDAQAMEKIVKLVNDTQKDYFIDLTQGQWENYYAQLFNAVVAGNPPNLGICHTNMLLSMKDALTPLDKSPAGDLLKIVGIDKKNYIPQLWKAANIDGKQYGVPLDTHMWAMWYNKKIFKEAGLDPNNPPRNLSELIKAAEAVKKAGYYAVHFAEDALPRKIMRAWYIFFWQLGGELFDKNYTKATFNNDKGLKALKFLVDSIHKYKWNEPGTDGFKQFASGKLGILFAGNWYYPTAVSAGIDFGVAPIPKIFIYPRTWGNSHNLVIPKLPPNANPQDYIDAAKVLKLISENSHLWGIYGGHMPAYLPAKQNKELLESDTWKRSLVVFSYMAENGYVHYPPNHPKAAELEQAIQSNIQLAYNGSITPEEALKRAEAECNRILNEYNAQKK